MALYPAIDCFHHNPMRLGPSCPWVGPPTIHHTYPHPSHPLRPYNWPLVHRSGSGYVDLEMDKSKFIVHVDVCHFSPDELSVHFTNDNWLVIEGKHEEKTDAHGTIERHFKRRYQVPADVAEDDMRCKISSNGILTVYVPRQQPTAKLEEGVKKVIPIQLANGPAPVTTDPRVVGNYAKCECEPCV